MDIIAEDLRALAPQVRLVMPAVQAPGSSGEPQSHGELEELVWICTSHRPVLLEPGEDPLAVAGGLLQDEEVWAVVLLLHRRAAERIRTRAGAGILVGVLEEYAHPGSADLLVALLLAAQHPPRARLVVLTGARGGLGTSTFLLHLARACAACSLRVALVDADPAGGLGLLIGEDLVPGLHWADLPDDESAFRPERLVSVLPTWLGMPVLTGDGRGGPSSLEAVGPALEALRATHDVVLLDLPRGASAPPGACVLLVSALDLRSVVAAEALATRLSAAGDLEDMQVLARLIGEDVGVEELAVVVGAPVLATIPQDRAVAQRVARGDDPTRGRGRLRTQARLVVDHLLEAVPDPDPEGDGHMDDAAWFPGGTLWPSATTPEEGTTPPRGDAGGSAPPAGLAGAPHRGRRAAQGLGLGLPEADASYPGRGGRRMTGTRDCLTRSVPS